MNSAEMAAVAAHEPLSVKTACLGFVASTAAMTLLMVLVGNLI